MVVGTGFGGAVAACRLSQAGLEPLVFERGRRYEENDFPALPHPGAFLPDLRRLTWQPYQGLFDVTDLEEIVSVQAAGYGGGSLIYANVHLRAPDDVFDRRWPEEYRVVGGSRPLDRYYDLVAAMIDPAPFPSLADGTDPPKTVVFERIERGSKASVFRPPLAIYFGLDATSQATQTDARGREQRPCQSCGACCTGCPHRAKSTLDFNYLAEAERRGARVRTECEVRAIERIPSGGWAVDYFDHRTAIKDRVETEALFLCAGVVHTTRLLAEWQDRTPAHGSRTLQSVLGFGYFPNADALAMVYDTSAPCAPSVGPTITTAAVHRPRVYPDEAWFMMQDGGYAASLDRLLGVLRAPIWGRRNRYPVAGKEPFLSRYPLGGSESTPEAILSPADRRVLTLGDDLDLQSPIDGVLQAIPEVIGKVVPGQLEGKLFPLFDAASSALLPDVVSLTIENALDRKLKWVERWFGAASFRCAVRFGKKLALRFLGPRNALARDAALALWRGGSLTRNEVAARVLGISAFGHDRRMMLLAMGRDRKPGRLHFDKATKRILADLDLYYLAPRYAEEELAMRDIAAGLGGELRVNPAWSFLGKPITVHSHGGCRMSEAPGAGVTDPDGQVHGYPGLYVLDASVLCASVGVNPSATIAAIAEYNISKFIKKATGKTWPTAELWEQADRWRKKADASGWTLTPPAPAAPAPQGPSKPFGLAFDESMDGFCDWCSVDPGMKDSEYRKLENQGRPDQPVEFKLTASARDLTRFLEDMTHSLRVEGEVTLRLPNASGDLGDLKPYCATGSLQLMIEDPIGVPVPVGHREKPYGLDPADPDDKNVIAEQQKIFGNPYTTSVGPPASFGPVEFARNLEFTRPLNVGRAKPNPAVGPSQRFMKYELCLEEKAPPPTSGATAAKSKAGQAKAGGSKSGGGPWCIEGYKRIRDEPQIDAWRATTTLYFNVSRKDGQNGPPAMAGAAHVNLPGFLEQLRSLRVFADDPKRPATEADGCDPARAAWMVTTFAAFFFGSLQRIYMPELRSMLAALFRLPGDRPRP